MSGLLIILAICAGLFMISTSVDFDDDLFGVLALIIVSIAAGWILGG